MWARKEIDLTLALWRRAIADCMTGGLLRPPDGFPFPEEFLPCLSVRTGFDRLLAQSRWPTGSEVIMTAVTIADMPKLVRHHGFVPVPVDICPNTLAPKLRDLEKSRSAQTRALVLTHLAGSAIDLAEISRWCNRHNVMLIDDRAQGFRGRADLLRSSRIADVCLWSFGPIKTSTALGGALIHVRDRVLREQIRMSLAQQPSLSTTRFVRRLAKYGLIRTLARPRVAATFTSGFRICGRDHDRFVSEMARGFAGADFFQRIRHQACDAQLRLMQWQASQETTPTLEKRIRAGRHLSEMLRDTVPVLGSDADEMTYWLFAILVDQPDALVRALWQAGYDATRRSSLVRVNRDQATQDSGTQDEVLLADRILESIVFLPLGSRMTEADETRMAEVIRRQHPQAPAWYAGLKNADIRNTGLPTAPFSSRGPRNPDGSFAAVG